MSEGKRRAPLKVRIPLILGVLLFCLSPRGLNLPLCFDLCPVLILSGSMEPALKTGSLHRMRRASPPYEAGQIIVYSRREGSFPLPFWVCHRIAEVYADGSMATKGDAEPNRDPYLVQPRDVIGRL